MRMIPEIITPTIGIPFSNARQSIPSRNFRLQFVLCFKLLAIKLLLSVTPHLVESPAHRFLILAYRRTLAFHTGRHSNFRSAVQALRKAFYYNQKDDKQRWDIC